MVGAGLFKLYRAKAGGIYRFSNKGVDIFKFSWRDLQVNTAQDVDRLRYGFPVKGSIIVNVQIQILCQSVYRLFLTALKISFIDLMVRALGVDL